jgi:hypothetical protein
VLGEDGVFVCDARVEEWRCWDGGGGHGGGWWWVMCTVGGVCFECCPL